MKNRSNKERALIAWGMEGRGVILATDGAFVGWEIENGYAGELVDELVGDDPDGAGMYLWEGYGEWSTHMTLDGESEPELYWDGTIRRVPFEEAVKLMEMIQPNEERQLMEPPSDADTFRITDEPKE